MGGAKLSQWSGLRICDQLWKFFSDHVIRDLAFINAPVGDGFTVSPDERSVLFSQIDPSGSDLLLVENFK